MAAAILLFASHLMGQEKAREENAKVDVAAEQDFKTRLEAFQKTGDMAQVETIYKAGDMTAQTGELYHAFESIIVRGVKGIEFKDVYPAIKDTFPLDLNGSKYVPNLPMYKMVSIQYQVPIKNGSAGTELLTGLKDGKIFICGLKAVEK